MDQINYGIIGCGMMGREHIRNIALLDNADVVAIYEPDAHMRALAQKLLPNVEFAPNVRELLEMNVDALLIASPNHMHISQLEEIAAIKSLPLLLEKPVLTEQADIARLYEIEKTYSAPIWVAMEYRYMPAVDAFINEAQDCTGGVTMLSIAEHRFPFLEKVGDWNRFNAKSGGTFVEKCCHFFDLMRHILKSDPLYVMAVGGQAHNHIDEVYGGKISDIWDHGFVILEFVNGRRASLELSMFAEGSPFQESITGIGHRGKLTAKIPGPTRFWPETRGPAPISVLEKFPRDPAEQFEVREIDVPTALLEVGDHNGSTFYQHQKFTQIIRENQMPEVTLHDGIWAAAIGLAAQISVNEKRAVYLEELIRG